MQPEVEAHSRALRDKCLVIVARVRRIVEVRRWGEFSEEKLANTLAARARTEYLRWGRKWTIEPNPPFFFEACQRAILFAFDDAAKSPKVDCVQAAALRRTYEPMTIGRNFFRARLWVELDAMLREGVDRIDEELLGWIGRSCTSTNSWTSTGTTSLLTAAPTKTRRPCLESSSRPAGAVALATSSPSRPR